jgi:hypothetical protein
MKDGYGILVERAVVLFGGNWDGITALSLSVIKAPDESYKDKYVSAPFIRLPAVIVCVFFVAVNCT